MRGDKEAECLDFIIQSIFHNKKGEVRQDCDGRSYLDVDEETFRKWWLCYAEIPHYFKFGLTEDDEIEFLNAIRKANANNKSSEFPDYIFDNGFIEHFQITSSKVTRKGSGQIIKEKSFERQLIRAAVRFLPAKRRRRHAVAIERCNGRVVDRLVGEPGVMRKIGNRSGRTVLL